MPSRLDNFLFPAVIVLFLYLGYATGKNYVPPFPQAGQMHSFSDSALSDAGVLSLGMRRLAADIWFIRLMQYYGTDQYLDEEKKEDSHQSGSPGHQHHDHCDHGDHDADIGEYPDIFPRSRHILDLDPYFTHAGLYSAGALAFNLGRPDEAIDLINHAKRYQPREWKYDAYLAAIGYRLAGNPEKVADMLAPVVRDPECPIMIKQLVAFLNKRIKRYRAAAEIYEDIAMTARNPYYIRNSRRELAKLEKILSSASGDRALKDESASPPALSRGSRPSLESSGSRSPSPEAEGSAATEGSWEAAEGLPLPNESADSGLSGR